MDDRHRESTPDGNTGEPGEPTIPSASASLPGEGGGSIAQAPSSVETTTRADDLTLTGGQEGGQPGEPRGDEGEIQGARLDPASTAVEPTDPLDERSAESPDDEESLEDDGIQTAELQAILDHQEALRQIGEVQAQYEHSRREAIEYKELALRKAADLENFKRRTQKQIEENNRYGMERVLKEFLPVVDDLERAIQHARTSVVEAPFDAGAENPYLSFIEGIALVLKKMQITLERFGVVGFESLGQPFNPQVHEALSQVEDSGHPTGMIVAEYMKGYQMHDRLIRPALVIVSRAPTPIEPLPAVEDAPPTSEGPPSSGSDSQPAIEEPAPDEGAGPPPSETDREGE